MISPLRQRREQSSTLLKFLTRDPNLDKFFENCTSHGVQEVKEMYDKFVNERSEVNPLFAFWSKYIEMLLLHIQATQTTDWRLHLSTLRSMISWFFTTDHVNYSRYAPCYWMEMMCLEQSNPCTYKSWLWSLSSFNFT